MLLHVIFIHYISICSANFQLYNSYTNIFIVNDRNQTHLERRSRQIAKKKDFVESTPTCEQLSQTSATPFVVLMLYKTSGRFLGMGSIIDKKTVITAAQVVQQAMKKPFRLLVLAGRLNPWWGKDSQVQPASEIFQVEPGLALVSLKNELKFNKNILPIKIPSGAEELDKEKFENEYGKDYAVFGIQRSSWDIPGESISKASVYVMKVETVPQSVDQCLHVYPDYDFNSTTMTCTFANGSFTWGCLGSPTVAVNTGDQILQVAVVVKTTFSETENFHFHLKLAAYEQWIRAHSLLGYKNK